MAHVDPVNVEFSMQDACNYLLTWHVGTYMIDNRTSNLALSTSIKCI